MTSAAVGLQSGAMRREAKEAAPVRRGNGAATAAAQDLAAAVFVEGREKFLPLTRSALLDRLTRESAWQAGRAAEARRLFRYLDYWRQQTYVARLMDLEQAYEAFSPDSDLLITRKFTDAEKASMQRRLVQQVAELMQQANYVSVDPKQVEVIMTKETHYGLDLHVDLSAFEEILIFYRGRTTRTETRRNKKKLYLRHETFDLPIFQRLFILFKLKPVEVRVREIMAEKGCDQEEAEKIVKKLRSVLPPQISSDNIYLKLFKNIPQADLEMIFPNTKIKFRMFDKLKLGATGGAGLGAGVFGAAGKIALLSTNPIAAAGAAVGLGGVAFRQAMNFVNQKNKYMVTMAQNLYFHAMADNRGVMTLMAERAAEEDIKEEMLLYSVLAKTTVHIDELHDVDIAIEKYLQANFGIEANFDVHDALHRLMRDGIVRQRDDGMLETLSPREAAQHVDMLWDKFLDELVDHAEEGVEFDDDEAKA